MVIASLRDMMQKDCLARTELADAYPQAFIDWCARKENNCAAGHWSRTFGPDAGQRLDATIARAYEVTRVCFEANARLGVSLDRLFRALTIDNARTLRLFLHGQALRRSDLSARAESGH